MVDLRRIAVLASSVLLVLALVPVELAATLGPAWLVVAVVAVLLAGAAVRIAQLRMRKLRTMLTAISGTVCEPMSNPTGAATRASASSGSPASRSSASHWGLGRPPRSQSVRASSRR